MADLRKVFTRTPATLDQWPVHIRWNRHRALTRVAFFHPDASHRTAAVLVFVVNPDALPAPEGEGTGIAFGHPQPGGAFVLLHDGHSIWPVKPPTRPWIRTPKR
jgi:hypothetical protein